MEIHPTCDRRRSEEEKTQYANRVEEAFPGTKLSGRADLHCYFWPQACQFLKEGGYFGFLTSGQWLDVDYGFALQRWILLNFRIVAILESSTERWFPDARVKTCITILQRCSDAEKRANNVVRFVRFEKPLAELIGVSATGDVEDDAESAEKARQKAVEAIRNEIEQLEEPVHDDRWRILLKPQSELWDEGRRAGEVLKPGLLAESDSSEEDAEVEEETEDEEGNDKQRWIEGHQPNEYVAGKWGRFLRAPDFYFELMSRFRKHFVPLGSIVDIRRGITSGCDAFFMPKDVSSEVLKEEPSEKGFRELVGASRKDVASGKVRVVKDGAGTLHPIETEYTKPEVHSLMKVDRPEIRAKDIDRVVLMVSDASSTLKGTYVYKYIKYGEGATYVSSKSKAVPVPERSTCAARDPWYDVTKLAKPGFAFWPMAQQYRHIIPGNPERLICNHNLFDLSSDDLSKKEQKVLVGILNSTLMGLFKTFYGRFAGTEGNLKTEVLDVNLIDVPDPREVNENVANRIINALQSMTKRDIGRLVEEAFMDCHSYERALELAARPLALSDELHQADRRELDDAVFELLGVESAKERKILIDRLYGETAAHFRAIRVTEIQKLEDRAKGEKQRFTASEQAADAWDALDLTDRTPLSDWVRTQVLGAGHQFEIPDERPVYLANGSIFDHETVYFGKKRQEHVVCSSREQAELLVRIANLGVTGFQILPPDDDAASKLLAALEGRHSSAMARIKQIVESRTADPEIREDVLKILERWFVLGRPKTNGKMPVN